MLNRIRISIADNLTFSYVLIVIMFISNIYVKTIQYHQIRKVYKYNIVQYLVEEIKKQVKKSKSQSIHRRENFLDPVYFEFIKQSVIKDSSITLLIYKHQLPILSTRGYIYDIYKICEIDKSIIITNISDNYLKNTSIYNELIGRIQNTDKVNAVNIVDFIYQYIYLTFEPEESENPILINTINDIIAIEKIKEKKKFFKEYDSFINEDELLPKITKFLNYYKVKYIVFSTKTGYYYKYEIVMNKNAQVKYVKRGIVYSR